MSPAAIVEHHIVFVLLLFGCCLCCCIGYHECLNVSRETEANLIGGRVGEGCNVGGLIA